MIETINFTIFKLKNFDSNENENRILNINIPNFSYDIKYKLINKLNLDYGLNQKKNIVVIVFFVDHKNVIFVIIIDFMIKKIQMFYLNVKI